MQLRKIFEYQIDRPIEGVIKADDDAGLKNEVEEYVFTDEIERRLDDFLDGYNNYQNANGVWLSGFFGCGKSHLLKMLALMLSGRQVDGLDVGQKLRSKIKDTMLVGRIDKALAIPSESILFNIDQKADVISKKNVDALLAVFVKVFDEKCGYYGKQGYIAHFERHLDQDGLLQPFRESFEKHAGMAWETGRERVLRVGSHIDNAFADVTGETVKGVIGKHKDDYKLSIEDFAEQVKKYIDGKGENFRLNFFVDEVGQYIADNTKLMTNLQTIAESLATKCRGRSWIIVTAQEDMTNVIGEMTKEQSNDFSKIQARFANRMKLTSTNVAEVIQKRLLLKTEEGEKQLRPIYNEEVNNFRTLFDFTDGQKHRNFQDEEHFFNCYPFIPYQFELFQFAIRGLSTHNAFEGKHSSVGERSMLGVFQEVAIHIADDQVGKLATFDLMYNGISSALKSHLLSTKNAEKQLDNKLAIKLLKVLLLVKYVKEFKASVHNLSVLMISGFDQDIGQLHKDVEEALNLLESQVYIQRSGDYYEFLTDEEKDVEQEIKNTEVDSSEVADELHKIIFEKVLRGRKLRYDPNKRDFSFTRKLDDKTYGREYELGVHVISPFHEHCENPDQVKMAYIGRSEVTVMLPPDARLIRDLTLMKQTAKYVGQNYQTTQKENVKRILGNKTTANQDRERQLVDHVKDLLGKSRMFVAGSEIESAKEDPGLRLHDGFEALVEQTYKNLRMLRGHTFTEAQIEDCLNQSSDGLFGNDAAVITEPESEILSRITLDVGKGMRPTLKKLVEDFETKPYGWPLSAIQCILAKVIARGKVEVRSDGQLLDGETLLSHLKNTGKFGNMVLEPQVDFSASQTRALREFHEQFFDEPPHANESKALGSETAEAFASLCDDLRDLSANARDYPFLDALTGPIDEFKKLGKKSHQHFLGEFDGDRDRLLDLKEDLLDPIRRFMSGPNANLFAEANQFLSRNETNFGYLEGDESVDLQKILADPKCYAGNSMQRVRSLIDSLKSRLETLATDARAAAEAAVTSRVQKLQAIPGYDTLSPEQRGEIDAIVQGTVDQIRTQPIIAVVREAAARFESKSYTDILGKVTQWTATPITLPPGESSDSEGRADSENPKSEIETPKFHKPVEFIGLRHLDISFDKPWLETTEDVDEYISKLSSAMTTAISYGKRIQL